MKKVMIFNFDGVICDSWRSAYEMNLLDWPNLTEEEHRSWFDGNIFEATSKKPDPLRSKEERDDYFKNVWQKREGVAMFKGIPELLHKLVNDNWILLLDSSDIDPSVSTFLEKHNISHLFSEAFYRKDFTSKREKLLHIKESYSENNDNRVVYITDTVGDALKGIDARVETIVTTWGYQKKEHIRNKLNNQKAIIVDTVNELESICINS